MAVKTGLVLLFLSTSFTEISAGWENLWLTTESFKNCPSTTPYPNPVTNINLRYGGEDGSLYVNATLKVSHVVTHGDKFEMNFFKCMIASDASSCSFFHRFELEFCDYCFGNPFLKRWTYAIKNFGPCPILPGSYPIVDMPLDFSNPGPWRVLPNPEQYIGHWTMNFKFISGDVLVTCFQMEGDAKKKRRKSKKSFPGLDLLNH